MKAPPPPPRRKNKTFDDDLNDLLAECLADPLRYVMTVFPWTTDASIQTVKLPAKYRARFPNCEFGPDLWACEYLDQLGEDIRTRAFDGRNAVAPIKYTVASGHGIGKAQPKDLVIDTPAGPRRWGDLRAGDFVFGINGQPTRIVATHEQGVKPVFTVALDDGSSTLACGEHLWNVRGRQERRNKRDGYRTMSTAEILEAGVQRPNGPATARQWELPRAAAVEFPAQSLHVTPYAMGAWLGDGTSRTGAITGDDPDVFEEIHREGWVVGARRDKSHTIHGMRPKLREAGILGGKTCNKAVPVEYLHNTSEVRAAVLRGLMDTDGTANEAGSAVFTSTSVQLAHDVRWLVRSLGGKASISPPKKRTCFFPNGTQVQGHDAWDVFVMMPAGFRLFAVERKQARLNAAVQERYLSRWIDAITPAGEAECMCITVEADDHLYLTNDFIPTHNSVMVAWLVKFIMDTRPYCKGTVTANTVPQLRTKTWAAVGDWHKMSLTSHRFDYRAGQQLALRSKEFPEKWFCTAQTCKEENSESFAGQHAANSTSFYIFDEASAVPSKIYEVREGGLTDGEPMVFDFGNPTRNSGEFYQNCINAVDRRYRFWKIDSRECQISNKLELDEWIRTRGGIDSDFCRVRIRGEFPHAGDLQFIATADVDDAAARPLSRDGYAPLVLGVDVAGDGGDDSVIYPRIGNDARSFAPFRYNGLDTVQLVGKVIEAIRFFKGLGLSVAGIFVDGGGLGKGVYDQLRHLGYQATNVQFGGHANDPQAYRRKGDEMWGAMRDAFKTGLCIPGDRSSLTDDLRTQLTSREFDDNSGPIHLETKREMKKRGIGSPDIADALALTYAQEVAPAVYGGLAAPMTFCNFQYDPMEKW